MAVLVTGCWYYDDIVTQTLTPNQRWGLCLTDQSASREELSADDGQGHSSDCANRHATPPPVPLPLQHVLSWLTDCSVAHSIPCTAVLCCHNRYTPTGSWLQVAPGGRAHLTRSDFTTIRKLSPMLWCVTRTQKKDTNSYHSEKEKGS